MPTLSRRLIVRGLAYTLTMVLVPLLAGAAGLGLRLAVDTTPPPFAGELPAAPVHDPQKRTAVVIAANRGSEGSDFLAPYAVIAQSGAFNLYAVAPERRITHLFPGRPSQRGVDIMPHYSFADYDAAVGGAPDLIVIPYLPFEQDPEYPLILEWIRRHAGPNTIVLSICAGAKAVADTGLLDGRRATTHHYTFAAIAKARPAVQLVEGVRYVEDGTMISSAGVTAGVDATLFALQRILGREAALGVAQQIGYPHARFLDDPSYTPPVAGKTGVFLAGSRLGNSQLGVALYAGMDELALASVIDTYPQVGSVTVQTIAPEREVLLSRHGLALVPRWSFADAPALDRLILPGRAAGAATAATFAAWAETRGELALDQVHQHEGYAYDLTFADMARRSGRALTAEAVYLLEYPLAQLPADAPRYPLALLARLFGLALLGLGLAALIDGSLSARGQRRRRRLARLATA
jgi:AraC family transcriptional regulator, transcriptional activator FtrA